jgi:hypothetical protein
MNARLDPGDGVTPVTVTVQGAQALILMGDWCAAVQPASENQVCGELGDGEVGFDKKEIRGWS